MEEMVEEEEEEFSAVESSRVNSRGGTIGEV